MKIYADRPARRLLQICGDAAALAWIAGWVWAAVALRDALTRLAGPGELLADAGSGLSSSMEDAAERVRELPVVGEGLSAPFGSVGAAGGTLSEAGQRFQEAAGDAALALPLLTALLPGLVVLVGWLPPRVRWVRQAADVRRARALDGDAADRLLALRALTRVPVGRLARVHADPAAAWRDGDAAATARLARVELDRLGLRP
ncbi:hypothetical protein [Marinitenerispora sediminis]|uniref:Uncharacterized protein n=1 Tax=Marinitenerispora sediminis TaxID=1931232 RepID=A0A368T8C0_9ACTN|nr:hypothetical protein [Marinitenerispora sediminis]RCV52626.1 hypothetical protein DEF28_12525 [Marinitenerispora sediminis]RCV60337.1 hypothetical protein DEF23_04895 [Marinitenerispora sediminis]RCV60590.1 hypothetical protein DEF24_06740 [Marinitenerispora sediminis]